MNKTKIQALKIQTTGVLTSDYNCVFSNAQIQLDGSLKLTNIANGLYLQINQDGVSGTLGTSGSFPAPSIAQYGFELSEPFNFLTMTALRDLATELQLQKIDSLLLLKNSEYVDNLKVVVDMPFPTYNGMENHFHNKAFAITAQTDDLIYFCPPSNSYIKFDLLNGIIQFLYNGSSDSNIQLGVNYLITTNLTELNNLGASGDPNKVIFEYIQTRTTVNKGRNSTVIRKK